MSRPALHAVPPPDPPSPRLALNVEEACAALGVSWDFWREHIAPEIRIVRRGRRLLVSVRELERWLDERASRPSPLTRRGALPDGS